MQRTDFKNLSKNDVISYASKLNELRSEVATQVLDQFPEFAKLIQSSLSDYKDVMEKMLLAMMKAQDKYTESYIKSWTKQAQVVKNL